VCISARSGEGLPELLEKLGEVLSRGQRRARFCIPYDKGTLVQLLHDEAAVLSVDYAEGGTEIEAVVKPELWARLRDYAKEETP